MADSQARIFISYRREDSAGHVLALLPALRRHFGDRVFKDTDNIPPGEDFVRFIKRELDSCSVLLAVIGRDWLNVQDPRLKTRRLDDPDDFLRIEVSTALRSERIRVIPVLVERSTMPTAADLPQDLAELAHRNALELSDARWESDVQILIQAIQRAFAPTDEPAEVLPRPELRDFQKRRAREIIAHMTAAQEAFDAQDYEGTLLSCEKALLLDPKGIDALELLDRARKAIENQKIEALLKQARQSLRHKDVADASDFIDQALSIDPASESALELRKEMLAVRCDRERNRERKRAVAAAAQRARTSLDQEDFDAAVRHADDALALEPESADAQEVRSRAVAVLDERRRQREARRRAQQAVTASREERGAGAQQGALLPVGTEENGAPERQEHERRAQEAAARIRTEMAGVVETQRQTVARAREPAEAERELECPSEVREPHADPESWSSRRYGTLGAAAAVILSAGLALWQYQRPSEPTPATETNQTSNAPGSAGRAEPSVTVGASGRGTASVPVATPTTRPEEEGRVGGNSTAPTSAKARETESGRRSSVVVPPPTAEPKKEETLAGSSVASIPTKPSGSTVSQMIMEAYGTPVPPDPARESMERVERSRITELMQRYLAAYNSRNVAAVKELYPSFDGDVERFVDKYELETVKISFAPGGGSAIVVATERTYYMYQGEKKPTTGPCTFTLRRQGDSWIIVSFTRDIHRNIRG